MKFATQVTNHASGRGKTRIKIAIARPSTTALSVPTMVTRRVTWRKDRNISGRTSHAKSQRQKLVVSSMSGASTVPATVVVSIVSIFIGTLPCYGRCGVVGNGGFGRHRRQNFFEA